MILHSCFTSFFMAFSDIAFINCNTESHRFRCFSSLLLRIELSYSRSCLNFSSIFNLVRFGQLLSLFLLKQEILGC